MGEYKDSFKRPTPWEFSADTQPKVHMPIVTKNERVQPYVSGVDKHGKMTWEGREMLRCPWNFYGSNTMATSWRIGSKNVLKT